MRSARVQWHGGPCESVLLPVGLMGQLPGGDLRGRPLRNLRSAFHARYATISVVAIARVMIYADPSPLSRLHGARRAAACIARCECLARQAEHHLVSSSTQPGSIRLTWLSIQLATRARR